MHRKKYNGLEVELARGALGFFVACYLLFLLFDAVFPLHTRIEYSTLVLSKEGELMHAFLTSDDKWRMYTELHEITPELKKAIVHKEDRFFFFHPGVNPVSVVRALVNNIREGKRTSGASTITMQVARLLVPRERTYRNKLIEIFRAFQIELTFTKVEILQLYLNLVPYGSNIEGVKSAAVIYFGKMPDHLSIAEITALAIIPNRPVSLQPGKNNTLILRERNKWLMRFGEDRLFQKEFIDDAMLEPLNAHRREVPRMAPHLAYRLKNTYPGKEIIRSTLNLEIQRKTEQMVSGYSKGLYFQNIKNATVLVVENATRKVRAYVGSADFFNNEDGGQVDGIRAIRSPGSTLKPLLYGMAMDKGILSPKTIVSDVPVSFGGYEPENYDEKFNGNITVEQALASSLNVPAVKILNELTPSVFTDKLVEANFSQIKIDREHLGLSSILGGCGVTLEELAGLFCCFADSGTYKPLLYAVSEEKNIHRRILSAGASYMITEILTQLKRPDFPVNWHNSKNTPRIAWKTGTSYGRRDAWSIGYNSRYTIGVWVGNFSGEGVPELNGAEKATPLLFRLFNTIDPKQVKDWFAMPDELELRYVCSHSGRIPGRLCSDLIIDYYLPGISDMRECDHLKEVFISPDSSISYCTACKPALGFRKAVYPNYTPEIITYFDENRLPYRKIPPHNPQCERLLSGSPPAITSPIHDNEYYVNVTDSMQIMLSCHTASDVQMVYWYVNNRYFATAPADEKVFFTPAEGEVNIACTDDKGRLSQIRIYVKHTDF